MNIQTNGKLTIIDTSNLTENLTAFTIKNSDGFYPIHYIGQYSDTIILRQRRIPRYGHGEEYFGDYVPVPDSNKIAIVVDTAFDLSYTHYYENYLAESDKPVIDSAVDYKAYPVIVRNLTDSLLYIGDCWDWTNIVRQVKNSEGRWIDIEIPFKYVCGTGCRPIVLEENQIMIAKLMRYKGNYKIECRLKLKLWNNEVYSNIFFDHIDINQIQERM